MTRPLTRGPNHPQLKDVAGLAAYFLGSGETSWGMANRPWDSMSGFEIYTTEEAAREEAEGAHVQGEPGARQDPMKHPGPA